MITLAHFKRLEAARLLAFAGVVFLVCGMLAGEIYAIFISHIANGVIRQSWLDLIAAVGTADAESVRQNFSVIHELTEKRGRIMNTHSHVGAYGLLSLVLAHIQPYLKLSATGRRVVAVLFIVGATLQFGSVYLSYYAGEWLLYSGDVGGILVIGACIRTLLALRFADGGEAPRGPHLAEQLATSASRLLLKGGFALIAGGMIFGLVYAGFLVSHDEPAVYTAINNAAALAADGNVAGSQEQIIRFKSAQSKIAITAAAHSHAIEFGFLMLMLSLVQRFVMLDDRWRRIWAGVLATGAFALPVCVFLATRYGLKAAAFADVFGALVLVALIAMGFGIARYSGVIDQESERVAA